MVAGVAKNAMADCFTDHPRAAFNSRIASRRLFEELGKIQLVEVVLSTRHGPDIQQRCLCRHFA